MEPPTSTVKCQFPSSGSGRSVWTRSGEILSAISVVALLYGVLTPLGFLLRAFGRRELRLQFQRQAPTYWIPRVPPGPPPESMSNQY
jgi:hypothetical protein